MAMRYADADARAELAHESMRTTKKTFDQIIDKLSHYRRNKITLQAKKLIIEELSRECKVA